MSLNPFAYLMLFGWPIVVMILFRRLPLPAALIWSILAGYLFLPERLSLNLPLMPDLDKHAVPALSAALFAFLAAKTASHRRTRADLTESLADDVVAPLREERKPHLVFTLLLIVAIGSPILTALANTDPVSFATMRLPGLGIKDALGTALSILITLLPFMLARRYLARTEDHVMLLKALVIACLIYSVLILIEARISPQLHRLVYGIHSHSFAQHIRGGHYRAMVFLGHGLKVGIFVAMAALAAATMWRVSRKLSEGPAKPARQANDGVFRRATDRSQKKPQAFATPSPFGYAIRLVWLCFVLVISRNLGSTGILLLLLPTILFLGIRTQVLIAAVIAAVILVYPLARGNGLIPTARIVALAETIDKGRAQSLEFRLRNEDMLIARANERPLLGWGGWGRNRIFSETTGEDLSVTDGTWIITAGVRGWIGYLSYFGLLAMPILLLMRRSRSGLDQAAAGLALLLAANMIDLIPNSGLTPLTWMIAGAVAGRVELTVKSQEAPGKRKRMQPAALSGMSAAPARSTPGRSGLSRRV